MGIKRIMRICVRVCVRMFVLSIYIDIEKKDEINRKEIRILK